MPTIKLRKSASPSQFVGRQYYRHITGAVYFEEDGDWYSATRKEGEPIELLHVIRVELLNDQEIGLTYTERGSNA